MSNLVDELDSFSGVAPSRLLTMWTEMFPSTRLTVGPDKRASSSETSWSISAAVSWDTS